jgi:type VI secretion system protein ImpM
VTAGAATTGFCGKLPARADFVIRRLPLAAVEAWHEWLQDALAAMRDALGDSWLDAYLYGPIWRFALAPGLIGTSAIAGTLMPSVDRVGRYFPLTIMLPLGSGAALAGMVAADPGWFAAAEEVSLMALGEGTELDDLDARIAALVPGQVAAFGLALAPGAPPSPGRVLAVDDAAFPADALAQLDRSASLWWTLGSERMAPVALIAQGLPAPAAFPALFSGAWAAHGWQTEGPP